jgi:hypothetical protein
VQIQKIDFFFGRLTGAVSFPLAFEMAEPAFNPLSSLAAFGDAFAMLLCSVFPSLPDGLHTFVILLADVFVRVHLDRAWERVVEMFAGRAAVATAKDHLSQAAPNYGGRERKVQDTTSR